MTSLTSSKICNHKTWFYMHWLCYLLISSQASLSITNSQSYSNSSPMSRWCHLTISSSVVSFSSRLQSLTASGSFPVSQLFASGGQTIEVSCSPRDSQESSPTPQFKSINSLVLNFLYSPALTSVHDYWKNHSLD